MLKKEKQQSYFLNIISSLIAYLLAFSILFWFLYLSKKIMAAIAVESLTKKSASKMLLTIYPFQLIKEKLQGLSDLTEQVKAAQLSKVT